MKLRQELDAVHPDWSTPFDYFSDLSKLSYLQMVINESMRLRPVASGQARISEVDMQTENGYVIPKGSNCIVKFNIMFRQGIKVRFDVTAVIRYCYLTYDCILLEW